jgi:hypothetical protein
MSRRVYVARLVLLLSEEELGVGERGSTDG